MKLLRINPRHFRAFGASEWIDAEGDLVLLVGPNGYGKTSLAEAIEWLFYGKTRRREKGDALDRLEYRGSYRNAHAPECSPTSVSAWVLFQDGSEHLIERELRIGTRGVDDSSVLCIDGQETSFASHGIEIKEAYYPVVAQHSLQEFIHARPIDRRSIVSAALGIEPLIGFKNVLEQARNSFRRDPPTAVTLARARVDAMVRRLRLVPGLAELANRWQEADFNDYKDQADILDACRRVLEDQTVGPEKAAQLLCDKRRMLLASVFDVDLIVLPHNHARLIRQVKDAAETLAQALKDLGTSTDQFNERSASVYAEELLKFWETGLRLASESSSGICPMCESPTLTNDKQLGLRDRVGANEEYRNAYSALKCATRKAVEAQSALRRALLDLDRPQLSEAQQTSLLSLFTNASNVISPLIESAEVCNSARTAAVDGCSRLEQSLTMMESRPQSSRARRRSSELVRAMQNRVARTCDKVCKAWELYKEVLSHCETAIADRVASHEDVQTVNLLIDVLEIRSELGVLAAYTRVLRETLADVREVETFIQAKQTELFETRGGEVQRWYDTLCPGADVRFSGMEAATDAVKLFAESFGRRIYAAPCLSQCQLNCLGLSLYMMQATTSESPFDFIVLDDPVQSMDDEHTESFICDILTRLLDEHGLQALLLSHLDPVTARVRQLHAHRNLVEYRIDEFTVSGPSVVPGSNLSEDLKQIQQWARGNERFRELAVDRLRVAIERFVRELHLKENGAPLDRSLSRATAAELLGAFCVIPRTTPQEHQAMRDTVRFADPAHHSEPGWQVPTQPQINPHIDRLRELARSKGLAQ